MNTLGQGSKVCLFVDLESVRKPHLKVSKEMLTRQVERYHSPDHSQARSLRVQLFEKTLAYFTSVQRLGCTGPLHEPSFFFGHEAETRNRHLQEKKKAQRGHYGMLKCEG